MVTPTQTTESLSGVAALNRGFVPEETIVATGLGGMPVMYYRPFWRPVLAGALFAISVMVLSWYLMLGCHVGISDDGLIGLGAGAAVWLCVSACIAYFFGGMIASAMTAPAGGSSSSGGLKGCILWAVSIPLSMIIYAIAAQSGPLVAELNLPHIAGATFAAAGAGFHWSMFIGLGLALIFSVIGGVAGGASCRKA